MLNIIVKKQTIAENERIENFVKIPKPITDPTMSYFIRVIRRIIEKTNIYESGGQS